MTLSQWYKQDAPTTKDLFDVHFVNPDVGWIVGMDGIILHTTNGGLTWESQISQDTTRWLLGVFAHDKNTCWAVGVDTLIIRTTDGGKTWIHVKLNVPLLDYWVATSIDFIGQDTGWIAGYYRVTSLDNSFILKTTDGGLTWNKQYLPINLCVPVALDALTASYAYMSCGYSIMRSTDGLTWQLVLDAPGEFAFTDIDFVTPNIGWFIFGGNGVSNIYRSDDSGSTAQIQLISSFAGVDIHTSFVDTIHGWVVQHSGSTDAIEIWGTSNGGWAWIKQLEYPYTPGYQRAKRILFIDSLNGWMVGEEGMVYHTDNGGVTNIQSEGDVLPREIFISQNYPNPFNPLTTISYELPNASSVVLRVYNLLGEEIRTLVNEIKPAGYHSVNFDGGNLPGGVYFYRLQAGSFLATKKLVLIK